MKKYIYEEEREYKYFCENCGCVIDETDYNVYNGLCPCCYELYLKEEYPEENVYELIQGDSSIGQNSGLQNH